MKDWRPHPRQEDFLRSNCFEALFGGAAGGGKSDALLIGALRHAGKPSYRGILFRRTFPELEKTLIDRSLQLYPSLGARYHTTRHEWAFPSGAKIYLGSIEHEKDVYDYQGAAFQYVGFDELPHFTEKQYRYLITRMRSVDGIPVRLRAGANPPHDEQGRWVLRRFAPWLYRPGIFPEEYDGPYAEPDQRLRFVRIGDEEQIVADDDVLWCHVCRAEWSVLEGAPPNVEKSCDHPVARDRVFFPAKLEDNPSLFDDGVYAATLQDADPVTYAQIRHGDWMIRAAPGNMFKRAWFPLEAPPTKTELVALVRYWDRAATEPSAENPDPDWTVGALLGRDRHGLEYVLDVHRGRWGPHGVPDQLLEVAEADAKKWGKRVYTIGLEQEPGASGKTEIASLTKLLSAYNVVVVRPTGDKVVRARPWSAYCKNQNVRLVAGPWNHSYLTEHEGFPGPGHDDQVDASSGAHALIATSAGGTKAKTRGKRAFAGAEGGGF